jgi:hypothetical protein
LRHWNAEFGKQCLGLILVEIQSRALTADAAVLSIKGNGLAK